jgi:flagellin
MTLLSNEGYDIVLEDYQLINLALPNMTVSGADRDLADVGHSFDIVENLDPNTVQVSGELELHSPFIYSVASSNVGTSADPTLLTGTTPGTAPSLGSAVPAVGTYVVNMTTASGSGSGMTAEITVAAGPTISDVQILNYGSGYSYSDTLTVSEALLGNSGSSNNVTFTINSTTTNTGTITNPGGIFSGNPSSADLSSVSELDVLTVSNAKRMLTSVDGALARIDLERSDLGATMSRMEHTINNLSNIAVNTKAARSRINDADIAAETTELTKAQVLNQAAQAMLSQANRSSQAIMSLLADL